MMKYVLSAILVLMLPGWSGGMMVCYHQGGLSPEGPPVVMDDDGGGDTTGGDTGPSEYRIGFHPILLTDEGGDTDSDGTTSPSE